MDSEVDSIADVSTNSWASHVPSEVLRQPAIAVNEDGTSFVRRCESKDAHHSLSQLKKNKEYEWTTDADFFDAPFILSQRLEKFFVMEVAWGARQAVEVAVGDILKKIRSHKWTASSWDVPRKTPALPEITHRDLKQIFTGGSFIPCFEIRMHCIVMCLPPVTCIVMHDRVLIHVNDIMDTDTLLVKLEELTATYAKKADETQTFFLNHDFTDEEDDTEIPLQPRTMLFEQSAKNSHVLKRDFIPLNRAIASGNPAALQNIPRFVLFPLEFAFLEIIIGYSFTNLRLELQRVEGLMRKLVQDAKNPKVNIKFIDYILEVKNPLHVLTENVKGISKAFNSLLDNSQDMAHMELTKLFYRPELYWKGGTSINPNLEILIEYFAQEIGQLESRVQKMNTAILDAQQHVTLRLSFKRNELHRWEVGCAVASLGLGAGAVLTGLLGMNVPNFQEENHFAFGWYAAAAALVALSSLSLALFVAMKTT